ncbi:hypothetical protein CAPTEDRAFT_195654 [Capitella teleta]|uniref:G-protein coupled receptors family 1 profile domain-containing protein n=1 Tax=Capitella teleta TaxID=283909 RepID=X1ZVC0_CAPTE|nr:hypothetical protein CAPTEDRAFT_195654 [Capitella teleta]|eukprot:ELT88369.1 hypothetical protein CAPTEDRAFT_195654 [Capitella teleta]
MGLHESVIDPGRQRTSAPELTTSEVMTPRGAEVWVRISGSDFHYKTSMDCQNVNYVSGNEYPTAQMSSFAGSRSPGIASRTILDNLDADNQHGDRVLLVVSNKVPTDSAMNDTYDRSTTEQPYTSVEASRIGSRNDVPVYTLIITSVASIGFSMNCFVLAVILSTKKLRKKISVTFLLSQCIMDTVSTANVLVFYLLEYLHVRLSGSSGQFYCRAIWSEFIIYSALHAAVCNTVALSGERYIAIVHPMTYKSLASRSKFIPIIVVCWVIGVVINAPFISMSKLGRNACYVTYFLDSLAAQNIYSVVTTVVTYFSPVVIIVYFYATMLRKLSSRVKLTSSGSGNSKATPSIGMLESIQTAQLRLTRTAIALGVAFFITWSPYNFYLVAYSAGANVNFADNMYYFCVIFAVGNTVVNPIIYVFSLHEFRTGAKRLCCRKYHGKQHESYAVNVWHSTNESNA